MKGQTIQIFLPDGDPTSIKVADITNRMIVAVLFPRNKLAEVEAREEIKRYGFYFLFGEDIEKAKPIAYIGETDNCHERIKTHDSKKHFWNHAIVISSKSNSFTKSHVKFLEYLCIRTAKEIARYDLDNHAIPSKPHITESMEADLLDNFETAKVLLATLGFPIFEPIPQRAKSKAVFYCKGKGASATGEMTNEGFVVFKGSTVNKDETKTIGSSSSNLRQKLIHSNILVLKGQLYEFKEDYIFSSPSAAADTVLGRSSNGWTQWRDVKGKTLDELYRS